MLTKLRAWIAAPPTPEITEAEALNLLGLDWSSEPPYLVFHTRDRVVVWDRESRRWYARTTETPAETGAS